MLELQICVVASLSKTQPPVGSEKRKRDTIIKVSSSMSTQSWLQTLASMALEC